MRLLARFGATIEDKRSVVGYEEDCAGVRSLLGTCLDVAYSSGRAGCCHRFASRQLVLLLVLLFLACPLFPGVPIGIGGNGAILKWDSSNPIAYKIDPGTLGTRDHEDGAQLARDAFDRWEAVETSTLGFADTGKLDVDVDVTNYMLFLNTPQPAVSIIFDADGEITDDLLGAGASNNVLGFASPSFPINGLYTYGIAVLNGLKAERPNLAQTITHELGHLVGLDHTLVNRQILALEAGLFLPLMYPMYPISLTGQTPDPKKDDIAWISWLYPTPDFQTASGTISGRTLRRSGFPFPGAHVVAVKLEPGPDDLPIESRFEVVSAVSDFLLQANGEFEIPGLTPGDYFVFFEPIGPFFTGGSGVGPINHRFLDFPKDFYNGENESGFATIDDPGERMPLTVVAGEEVDGIELISNNTPPEDRDDGLDALGDDDTVLYEFAGGFVFPFAGKVFGSVHVNSDGNLTFLEGDDDSTPRDLARIFGLFGDLPLPRIAPLFTDLDSGQSGEIRAIPLPGQITFEWDQVPEFSTSEDPSPGNSFSVTLLSTGDIKFQYEDIQITPDSDGVQVVTGVFPGFFASGPGVAQDLSSFEEAIPLDGAPAYESFQDESFDLSGTEIHLQAATTPFYFPFYHQNPGFFTGFAATNFGSSSSALTFANKEVDGTSSPDPDNPHVEGLLSQKQFARLGSELFGSAPNEQQDGWVYFHGSSGNIASFFQFGNGLSGPLDQLDGGVALTQQSKVLYFTRLYRGAVFPTAAGPLMAETVISIANPNAEEIDIALNCFDTDGQLLGETGLRTIPSEGFIRESLSSLIGTEGPISSGHLRVDVIEGPGAVGFALIQLPESIFGLNAVTDTSAQTLYSAQMANGGSAGVFNFTSLKLVNTSTQARTVVVTAIADSGATIGTFQTTLNPGGSLQSDVSGLFSLGSNLGDLTTGSVQIAADGPGIIGDVVFGDPEAAAYAAALLLQRQSLSEAVLSQVAVGATNPTDPSTHFFTGLALFVPGDSPVDVTIRVFDPQGRLKGQALVTLGAGQRISSVIPELIPSIETLLGGYIHIGTEGGSIVVQQLFGNSLLGFLSAVPATIIQ